MSIFAIFVASFMGSLHCAAMCGGFVAWLGGRAKPLQSLLTYHLGRAVAYGTIGAAAGTIGKATNKLGTLASISNFANLAIAVSFLFLAWSSAKARGRNELVSIGAPSQAFVLGSVPHWLRTSHLYSSLLGLTSALLPCGWLYANALIAANTASPLYGSIMMLAFWLGTLPALCSITFFSSFTSNYIREGRRLILSLVYLAFAAYSLYLHLAANHDHHHASHHNETHHRMLNK